MQPCTVYRERCFGTKKERKKRGKMDGENSGLLKAGGESHYSAFGFGLSGDSQVM